MAVTDEQRNKVLTGAGLEQYTKLLKSKFGAIDEEIAAVSTTVGGIINEVWDGGDTTQDSRIDNLETSVNGITTTTIPAIQEQITGLTTTYKELQVAAELTAPEGEYISGINQTVQGVVSITTTALPVVPDASASTPGLVQMASDATTNVVYDKSQVDGLFDGVTTTIAGLGGTYKVLQEVVAITAPVGSYISEISQDAQGVVGISTTALPVIGSASDAVAGIVQMASGATTNVVYDSEQVDDKIDGLSESITGLTSVYKQLQNTYDSGATVALTFIDYIEQNENGEISVSKSEVELPDVASALTPGLVTVVGVTNPVADEYEVYNKDKIDELIADIQGGGSGLDGRYKQIQTAVTNPVASGNTITFISGITQNEQGIINPIAMTVPTASTTSVGLVQMSPGATTSVVYDKDEVDSLIAEQASAAFVAAITANIPVAADADNNTIYFIANGATTGDNIYDEYLKVNKGSAETPNYAMEKIGSTEFSFDTLSNGDVTTIWTDTPAAD